MAASRDTGPIMGRTDVPGAFARDNDQQRLLGTPQDHPFLSSTPLPDYFESPESRSTSTPFFKASMRPSETPRKRLKWYSVAPIFAAGIYSTLISGAWLGIAIAKPPWPFVNYTEGILNAANTSTLTTAISRTVELSFVTFYLTMLGQHLTRKASNNLSSGISLADLQLKVLMVLPGTLFTQWRSYGHALRSVIGVTSLIACICAMVYTTAGDALVAPKPIQTYQYKSIVGPLRATPANFSYISDSCPALEAGEPTSESQCFTVKHAGTAYTDLMHFLTSWRQPSTAQTTNDTTQRPPPVAFFRENITVQGAWVDPVDTIAASNQYKRTITNVSMAIPHAGVVDAATQAINSLQLKFFDADSTLKIDAQTAVPEINVLCAGGTADDVHPLIYSNFSNIPAKPITDNLAAFSERNWFNSTPFDPIFGFSKERPPPIFFRLPGANNSVGNLYSQAKYAQFLLLPSNHSNQINYNLCRLSISLRSGCSSEMFTSMSSSKLSANCAQHDMSFNQTLPSSPDLAWAWSTVSFQWAEAISLDASPSDAMAATPYMLAELAPDNPAIPTHKPTLVEGLAVLSACTLLDSMVDAPYNGSWLAGNKTLASPVNQPLQARVTWNQYASPGAREPWQNIFMLVLAFVFLINLICFSYLLYITLFRSCLSRLKSNSNRNRNGMRADYTDLNTLFQVALNSPSPRLGDLPGRGGRVGKKESVYRKRWHLREGGVRGGHDGLDGADGLCVAFEGEEMGAVEEGGQGGTKGMYLTPPSSEFFSQGGTPLQRMEQEQQERERDFPRGTRKGFTPLGFEDPSYT